jgi:hypothetical protein
VVRGAIAQFQREVVWQISSLLRRGWGARTVRRSQCASRSGVDFSKLSGLTRYYRRGPGQNFPRNLLISRNLIGVGLSGGNQQKVALGRAAATHPKLLLLNEPTRGIDVGARSEIYRRLKDLAKQGLTVIFYSTDLEEVGQLADRVVNFFRGNIVTSKPASRTSAREILYEILHGKEIPVNDQGEDKHVSS